jgi:hypothetical protein
MNKKQLDELQNLPEELRYKLAKYMYIHESEHFDKRVNGSKPKKKQKYSVPLIKHESTLDDYLRDKYSTATAVEQPKVERGYGLPSLFRSKN